MKKDDEILNSLIGRGYIGSTLVSLLSKHKKNGGIIGTLAEAVILATFRANENAQKTNIPVYIEDKGIVYEVNSEGERKFIKKIQESLKKVPKKFQLH